MYRRSPQQVLCERFLEGSHPASMHGRSPLSPFFRKKKTQKKSKKELIKKKSLIEFEKLKNDENNLVLCPPLIDENMFIRFYRFHIVSFTQTKSNISKTKHFIWNIVKIKTNQTVIWRQKETDK